MLVLKNISKKYKKVVLDNFNYQFGDGIYVIKGQSGIGKTTLLDILYGEVKPDSGEINIDGIETPYKKLKKTIFFSYLKSYSLLNLSKSFNKNIKSFKKNSLVDFDFELLNYLIDFFNFRDMVDKPLYQLSGGQVKLANIIFTFSKKSYFYLLDEPFSDLDESNKTKVKEIITDKLKNKCVIIVNHENEAIGFDYTGIIDLDKGEFTAKETTCSFNEEYCRKPIKTKNQLIILLSSLKENIGFNLMFLFLTILCALSSGIAYAYAPLSQVDNFEVCIKNDPYTYEKIVDPQAKYSENQAVGDTRYITKLGELMSLFSFNSNGENLTFGRLNNVYVVTSEDIEKPTVYNSDLISNANIDFESIFSQVDYKDAAYQGFDSYYFVDNDLEEALVLEISENEYVNLFKNGKIRELKNSDGNNFINQNSLNGFYIGGLDTRTFFPIEFDEEVDNIVVPNRFAGMNASIFTSSYDAKYFINISDISVTYDEVSSIHISRNAYFKLLTTLDLQSFLVNKSEINYFTDYLNFKIPTLPTYQEFFETDSLYFVVSLIGLIVAITLFIFIVGFTCYFKFKKPLTKEVKSRLKLYNFSNIEIKLYDYLAIYLSGIVALIVAIPVACQQTISINTLIRDKYFTNGYSLSAFANKYSEISLVMFKEIDVLTVLNIVLVLIALIAFIIIILNILRNIYARTKGNK